MVISGKEYCSRQDEEVINNVEKIFSNSDGNNNDNNNSRPAEISMVAQERPLIDDEQCVPLIDQEKWELGQLFRRPTLPMVLDHSESTTLDGEDEEGKLIDTTWSKYAKAILPHVGLILLSMIYVITGASAFYYLERPHELRIRRTYVRNVTILKVNFLKDVFYSGRGENRLLESKLTEVEVYRPSQQLGRSEAENRLEGITKKIFEAFDTHYVEAGHLLYDEEAGSVRDRADNRTDADDVVWTFNAAIFFSSTLLTTIGYGNLVPVTFEGRVFCICYGLLGVPLILITVTDIGKFLAEHITYIYGSYAQWRRRLRTAARRRNKRRNRTAPARRSTQNGGPSVPTDQLSASVPRKENHDQVDDTLSPILGDQMTTESNHIGNENREEQNEDDEDPDHEVVSDPFVEVPTILILSILVGYMLLGAFLISYLESWTFFDGFYFAFISLTTIGFGDYVPENQSYYMFDMLYIFFGLAITTMCIDLVGAQYIEKIHNFGCAIKDARYALINVGGKMVQVRDLMKYSAFLHKKYGLTENRARLLERNSLLVPKNTLTSKYPDAFTPKEIRYIKYIDYVISSENLIASDVAVGTPFSRSRSNSNFTTYSAMATTSSSRA